MQEKEAGRRELLVFFLNGCVPSNCQYRPQVYKDCRPNKTNEWKLIEGVSSVYRRFIISFIPWFSHREDDEPKNLPNCLVPFD